MNIGAQLRVYDVEDATKVPAKFRFPFYKRMNWYAARYYHDLLQGTFTKDMPIDCTANKTVLFSSRSGNEKRIIKVRAGGPYLLGTMVEEGYTKRVAKRYSP